MKIGTFDTTRINSRNGTNRRNACMIVAEIGTSHGGELDEAFRLIDAAAESGADCVKFQIVYADEILHPLTGKVRLPGGLVSLYDRFKALERSPEFFAELKGYSEKKGLVFMCTPFGTSSARILKDLGCTVIKIASPELNHFPLLQEVSRYGVSLILSTGVSKLSDIERALEITGLNVMLLHCITQYPAPEEEYNLKIIPHLSTLTGVPVGLSDHSLDPCLVPVLAVSMGAPLIEKHLALSEKGRGLDDPIALIPEQFSRMAQAVRKAESMGEREILDWMADEYGRVRIERVLGTGRKELAPSERDNYGKSNRSIHAVARIEKGHAITEERVALLRSERNLRPGLAPQFLPDMIGRKAQRVIESGEGIQWNDILP